MRFASICSGIGGAEVAFGRLGWDCAFLSEIAPLPRAVLSHHFPNIPLHGDFREIQYQEEPLDLLIGGPPCQGFSVAGKRRGMDDPRSQLSIEYIRLVERVRPRWVIYENVPGLLSSNGGRDFGALIGALEQCGYSLAWGVLDAQHFGSSQRRKRVFVVGYLGANWQYPAAVLFNGAGLPGDPSPREIAGKGEDVALCVTSRFGSGRNDPTAETYIPVNVNGTLRVRRLTPLECERLQGFPDGWTHVPVRQRKNGTIVMASDSARYKAIGNAFQVDVISWIGSRIAMLEAHRAEAVQEI